MTFIFKKTIMIDISLTFKKCHNKRICDIFLTVVNMQMMTVICCYKIVINDIYFLSNYCDSFRKLSWKDFHDSQYYDCKQLSRILFVTENN